MINEKNYKQFIALALYSGEDMTARQVSEIMERRGVLTKSGNPYDPPGIRKLKKKAADEIEKLTKKFYQHP